MTDVNYQSWAVDLLTLLDAIELAIGDGDVDTAVVLLRGRFEITRKHGLWVEFTGQGAGRLQ